jgi:ribosome-associated translation inhibitor RaiA|tara:strand:- start:1037 stop:1339 length:303 start_codon:yes stop_codon:yes gene_type:complete
MEENIQILGLNEFDEKEKNDIVDLTKLYYRKIERDLQGLLKIHAKKHDKAGKRAKYSFHAKIQTPISLINVKDDDWDLHKALHKVLKKVENQVKHKFKTE